MSRQEHPSWQDELMPYVDGELVSEQVDRIAAHVDECSECAQAVADAKRLSTQMAAWEVEDAPERLSQAVLAELQSRVVRSLRGSKSVSTWENRGRVMAYGLAGAFIIFLLVVFASTLSPRTPPSVVDMEDLNFDQAGTPAGPAGPAASGESAAGAANSGVTNFDRSPASQQGQQGLGGSVTPNLQPPLGTDTGPMVIRTIQLNLISKEFDTARTRIETVVREASGYVDRLTVQSDPGSAKSLSAVLRFPAGRVDAALVELRKLGLVKVESQNSTDVSRQYADLVARLNNARNTEQRLLVMLRERTGRLQDVIEAEREIARVRGDIERMEAEQRTLNNKVQYSSVQLDVAEEYRAQLEPSAPSAGTRLRNAAVEGVKTAAETVLGIILAVLELGPTLLVLAALVAPVAFGVWRISRGVPAWTKRNG